MTAFSSKATIHHIIFCCVCIERAFITPNLFLMGIRMHPSAMSKFQLQYVVLFLATPLRILGGTILLNLQCWPRLYRLLRKNPITADIFLQNPFSNSTQTWPYWRGKGLGPGWVESYCSWSDEVSKLRLLGKVNCEHRCQVQGALGARAPTIFLGVLSTHNEWL